MTIPKKLYKYRKFDVRTLRMITDAETYYANPEDFNDPMDCKPTIDVDIKVSDLGKVYVSLLPPDREAFAQQRLQNHLNHARQHEYQYGTIDRQKFLASAIAVDITEELKRTLGSHGVLAFASTWRSLLMWSHYADEHRGVCIEYTTDGMPHPELRPVDYRGGRAIKASELFAWKVAGNLEAGERVKHIYYYAKAPGWRYEKEWRDLRERTEVGTSYAISGIYFGLRCDDAARVAVVKMLSDHSKMGLFDINLAEDGFRLKRSAVDRGEIEALGIRPPMEIMMHQFVNDLDDLPDDPNGEQMLVDSFQ